MGNPFKPGTVYYAHVPAEHCHPNECRDNPDKGPRPWIVLYCRQHANTGVVLAAPLLSKGNPDVLSHVPCTADHFDVPVNGPGISQAGYIHLDQLRALDKERLVLDRGPLGAMKKQPFQEVRSRLVGMLEPRLLPR